jgi:hypothetical protein
MKRAKKIMLLAVSIIFTLSVTGCNRNSLSTEAEGGLKAFEAMIKTYPDKIGFHKALEHWGFKLPTGEKFEWSKDMSANKADFAMVMLADPFIKAGLDVKKLNDEWLFKPAGKEEGEDLPNLLVKPYNVSDKKLSSNGSEDSMRRLLQQDAKLVEYHKELQHYRLKLGEGFEVQWTEKLGLNDADMIFVLKAEPLVKAGLDVKKLEGSGWIFKPASKDNMGMGENPDQLVKILKLK